MSGHSHSSKVHILSACVLITAAVALACSPEGARAESNDDEDERLATRQRPLSIASFRLQTVRERELTGYVGGRVDTDALTLVWYWKGAVPQELADLMRDLEQDLEITIDVRPARYSRAELLAEARRIISLSPEQAGIRIRETGSLPDYSGISVGVHPADLDKAPDAVKSSFKLKFVPGHEWIDLARAGRRADPLVVSVAAAFGLLVWVALGKLMYRARRKVRP